MEILEKEEDKSMEWLIKNGPISDIAVSTHEDYDQDLLSNGYFQITADESLLNGIFACRGCSVEKVISNLQIKKKEELTDSDYTRSVIHISYYYSLVYDVKNLSKTEGKNTESNLIQSFSINKKGDGYEIKSELSSIEYDYNSKDKVIDIRVLTPPEGEINHPDGGGQTSADIQIEQIIFNYCAEFCNRKKRVDTHKCFVLPKQFLLFRFKSMILSKRNVRKALKNTNSTQTPPEIVVLKSTNDFENACNSCNRTRLTENVLIKPGTEVYSEAQDCELEFSSEGELKINDIANKKTETVLSAKPDNIKLQARLSNEGEFIVFSKTGVVQWTGGKKVTGTTFSHPFKAVVKSENKKCKLFILDSKDKSIWSN